jgi:hypothetical protein
MDGGSLCKNRVIPVDVEYLFLEKIVIWILMAFM